MISVISVISAQGNLYAVNGCWAGYSAHRQDTVVADDGRPLHVRAGTIICGVAPLYVTDEAGRQYVSRGPGQLEPVQSATLDNFERLLCEGPG